MRKEELERMMALTSNEGERRLIQEAIARLEEGPKNPGLLELLDLPLRKTKEAVSGDESVWFNNVNAQGEQRMPHEAYAASQVAGDLLLDPVNMVGGGMLKAGRGLLKGAGVAKNSAQGMITAAANNYIPNFYVPKAIGEASTAAEKLAAKVLLKQGKFQGKVIDTAEKAKGAAEKGVSTLRTAVEGGFHGLKDTLNPYARALWKEHGISREGQNIIRKELAKGAGTGADRAYAKAGGELIYQGHNAIQGGRDIPAGPVRDFLNKALLEWYQPMQNGTLKELFLRNAPTKNPVPVKGRKGLSEGPPAPITERQAEFAEEFTKRQWPGVDTVVMKRPEQTLSGKHQFDLLGPKNYSMMAIKNALKNKVYKTNDELAEALEAYSKAHKDKGIRVIRDGDEIYLSSSRPGTAIVEGGYRGLHNVDKNGEIFAIMSDQHDFLENVPVLGTIVDKYLPKKLLAVTPPLRTNYYTKPAKGYRGGYDQAGAKKFYELSKDAPMLDDLKAAAKLKPSSDVVKGEALRQGGAATILRPRSGEEDQP